MNADIRKDKDTISSMFNNIAGKYDFLNRVLSFGIDKIWRARLVNFVKSQNPKRVLDLACGTGDLTIALNKKGFVVVGMDIAEKMVEIAIKKSPKNDSIQYVIASADFIPEPDLSFDCVTIAFGIRNFENRQSSLKEIHRILNKGGSLAILEFATPKNRLWRAVYTLYFLKILPVIGRIVSKDKSAYSYLPLSVSTFPQFNEFCKELQGAGFNTVKYKSLSGGIAVLYTALK